MFRLKISGTDMQRRGSRQNGTRIDVIGAFLDFSVMVPEASEEVGEVVEVRHEVSTDFIDPWLQKELPRDNFLHSGLELGLGLGLGSGNSRRGLRFGAFLLPRHGVHELQKSTDTTADESNFLWDTQFDVRLGKALRLGSGL